MTYKSESELKKMREAAEIAAIAMQKVIEAVRPGITTKRLDKIAYDYIISRGAQPNFLNYNGFPGTICASVNEEIVHGFPSERKLHEGDIIRVDMGAVIHGYHSDMARTIPVGEIAPEVEELIKVTRQSFFEGIKNAVPGNHVVDISRGIEEYVRPYGFGIVRELVGHGVGQSLHEPPDVPNYVTKRRGPKLHEGMTLAVEPMITLGKPTVVVRNDGWTYCTKDGKPAAHYENTIAINSHGEPEILTLLEGME